MATNRLSVTVGSSPKFTITLQVDEIQTDAPGNRSLVRAYLVLSASSSAAFYAYHDGTITGTLGGNSFTVSGTDADVTKGSMGWTKGPWDFWIGHNGAGGLTLSLALSVKYPSLSSGSASTSGSMALTTLTVAPGTPTSPTLTRNSDTQMTLKWTRNEATNGVATGFAVQTSTNGAAMAAAGSIQPASTVTLATAANRKVTARVQASNSKGTSAWSATSNAIWTTPAAPTGVSAVKNADNSVTVTWTPKAAYSEHQHIVQHGVVGSNNAITWDSGTLGTVAGGTSTFKHSNPPTTQVHVYRVAAQTTATPTLTSAYTQSNSIQLLTAPNAPTLKTLPQTANKTVALTVTWTHNPVDSTAQTAYQIQYSTDAGKTWTTVAKTTSTTSSWTIPANQWGGNTALTVRVRTWGLATTGGSDSTGASAWSNQSTVTFKTPPVASITSPANNAVVTQAALIVTVGFTQAESATPVRATITLTDVTANKVLETLNTTTLPSTRMATRLIDGGTYKLTATALDSNGLTSAASAASTFTVDYTDPVPADVTATYLPDSGSGQIDIDIAAPVGASQTTTVSITVSRIVNGVSELMVDHFAVPSGGHITLIDPIPALDGETSYQITSWSQDGAAVTVETSMTAFEGRWCYCNTGPGWQYGIRFWGNLALGSTPARDMALVTAAQRARPIALFGAAGGGTFTLAGSATIPADDDDGSSIEQIEDFLLTADTVCYRDPTGRRIFGAMTGSTSGRKYAAASFSYTISETSH